MFDRFGFGWHVYCSLKESRTLKVLDITGYTPVVLHQQKGIFMESRTIFWLENVKTLLTHEFCSEFFEILKTKLDEVDYESIPLMSSEEIYRLQSNLFYRLNSRDNGKDIDYILDYISDENSHLSKFSKALNCISSCVLLKTNLQPIRSIVSNLSISDFSERGKKVASAIIGVNSIISFLGTDANSKVVEKAIFDDNGELLRNLLVKIMGESL